MTRQEKYPNTRTFEFYNANPKNKYTGDCVIRAICTALDQTWEQTLRELTELGIKYGYCYDDDKLYSRYLEQKGWIKHTQPRKWDNTKYEGWEFCTQLAKKDKVYIAHIGGHHIVCIKNNKVHDIWNSTGGCIGNYWTKA